MPSENDLREWLQRNCPNVCSLFNQRAHTNLPRGFIEYLSPLAQTKLDELAAHFPDLTPEYLHKIREDPAQQGKDNLLVADQQIKQLITACGPTMVEHTYRRDISGVNTATQLAELLCEITLCASASKLSRIPPQLRPPSGKGTYCDVSFELAGSRIYGEAKRYEDTWFSKLDPSRSLSRSLVEAAPGTKSAGSSRPRAINLVSKLHGVPRQLPEGTLNFLFVFHSSIGDSHRYLQQVLFGESTFFDTPNKVTLDTDGLFATGEWRLISGCCLSTILPDGALLCLVTWENPQALVPIPRLVHAALNRLKRQDVSLE